MMTPQWVVVALLAILPLSPATDIPAVHGGEILYDISSVFQELEEVLAGQQNVQADDFEQLRSGLKDLGSQVMLQQFMLEEKTRTDGNSGIKQQRFARDGPMNYFTASHTSRQVFNIHDHPDHNLTVGLGELIVVLNGIEFRTRHNDYMLYMKSNTTTEYGIVQDLPFPEVPQSVLDKDTVEEEISEMREYFKAFHTQNDTLRDFKPFFKPVLCYLEGAWTLDHNFSEPFQSDRHFVDASTWKELNEKNRFEAYSGQKSLGENLANLPTTIINVDPDTGVISYARWTYRILCHPISRHIPTKYFRPVEDLQSRLPYYRSFESHYNSRGARFILYEKTSDEFFDYSLLDELMYEIPGMNNLAENMTSEEMDPKPVFDVNSPDPDNPVTLKVGYYHRRYMFNTTGAMGLKESSRGFSDANLFMARTTQYNIAPVKLERCRRINGKMTCEYEYFRFSYCIPLEIIYLTPLFKWNPHKLQFFNDRLGVIGDPPTQTGRFMKPYYGVANQYFYQTPEEFYSGLNITDRDPADTASTTDIFVLDENNVKHKMSPSGVYIRTPPIKDVGRVRLRYPIAPVFGEGSGVWKELNAIRQILTDDRVMEGWTTTVSFEMEMTTKDPPGAHSHTFTVKNDALSSLVAGLEGIIWVNTEMSHNHDHYIRMKYNETINEFYYDRCTVKEENAPVLLTCWDDHPKKLTELESLDRIFENAAALREAAGEAPGDTTQSSK